MDRNPRFSSLFLSPLFALALLVLGGCDDKSLPWPAGAGTERDRACEPAGINPGPRRGAEAGPGEQDNPKPGTDPDANPKAEPGSESESEDPENPGEDSSDGSSEGSGDSGNEEPKAPSLGLMLWEILYNPARTDGAAESPETVDLLVTGPPEAEGSVTFELQGQGWSLLTPQDLGMAADLKVQTGTLLRIERYKNASELEKANGLFPSREVLDPKTGRVAVHILRVTGAGLRNKGGWLKLRSGAESTIQGVIYGDINDEKIDAEVRDAWKGPAAKAAPNAQALCKIPDSHLQERTDAAWWTACKASTWGRDPS